MVGILSAGIWRVYNTLGIKASFSFLNGRIIISYIALLV
jgi:hypothetical protein